MLKNLRNIAVVSVSTVGSRIFGLVRDILMFAALGATLWSDAFIIAFTIPNLFRRLLGEGALTSAVVPIFSDVLKKSGREQAFAFLNQVLFRLMLLLIVLVIGGIFGLALISDSGLLPERWALGAGLSAILLPYMLFVCLAAIVSAGLNLIGRFAAAAGTPIILNISIIGSLTLGMWLEDDPHKIVYWLCCGVLVGGLLQLSVPMCDLAYQGWRPKVSKGFKSEIRELWHLLTPGLLGAAILQVNILVSRLLAYSLDASSVSILYLASRLMELPLGVFTVSVATVFFPLLARSIANQDKQSFAASFAQGMRLILGVSIPAGIGLMIVGEPVLELCRWGAFDYGDAVQKTVPLIAIYGFGLPFYSAATFVTRGLHAYKDMKSPVRIAGICLVVNLFSGAVLMQFLGAAGLAASNVIAAILQSILLWKALSKQSLELRALSFRNAFGKILASGAIMGLIGVTGNQILTHLGLQNKAYGLVTMFLTIPACVIIYFAVLHILKFEELKILSSYLKNRWLSPKQKQPSLQ